MKAKLTTLSSGLRVITVPMKDNPTVTVMVAVDAGSKYESKKINGLSHFLEHMCFKGTERRPKGIDISRELDGLGAQSNAFTDQEITGYWAKGRAKNFEKLLDVVADVYLNSTFPEAELEKEKGVIIDEINMYEDMPMRSIHDVLWNLLYGDQPAGWTILGPKKNIRAMTRADFLKYHKEHYVASSTTVIVAGGINSSNVVRAVKQQFADVPRSKKHSKKKVTWKQSRPQVAVKYKKTDQTHIALAFRGVPANHADRPALDVIAALLGKGMSSRLFERLREQMGVGYYVRTYNEDSTDSGHVEILTGVANARAMEVVTAILEECQRIIDEPITSAELQKTKEYMIGNLELYLESSDNLATMYGYQMAVQQKLTNPNEIIREIKKVTVNDVQRIAKKYFTNDRLNLALVGPFKTTDRFKKILKLG